MQMNRLNDFKISKIFTYFSADSIKNVKIIIYKYYLKKLLG